MNPPLRVACRLRRAFRETFAVFMALLLAVPVTPATAQIDERALKAAYLFNFIQFTQWPVPPDEPFRLCVLGTTPLDAELKKLEGKPVLGGLHIGVRHIGVKDSLTGCHALYVDDSQRSQVDEVLVRLAGAPVLTVTDGDGLADKGVMIEIHKRDARLGFEVNLKVARRANLNFSARMLKLASYVAGAL
ncbi:YfiR family protein [Ideonella sp. DXS29W]|uniref:YfiR family protein n=1 Tax=Ideonella lacteola TaxID=2984193 RepID=A0ABU9BNA2_9BURK